jgi:hypothetical protein
MTTYSPIKRIDCPDGERYVQIEVRDDGQLFRFTEISQQTEDGYEFWAATHISGLYPDAASAEREARIDIPWLRSGNSN